MSQENSLLKEAIIAYDSGNIEDFETIAKKAYNSCAVYPSPVPNLKHKYLWGTVFAYYCQMPNNINVRATSFENAYYCLSRVLMESESISEKQCAAIRLLLLIDENNIVTMDLINRFMDQHADLVSRKPAVNVRVLNQLMDNAFYKDVVRMLGGYLIEEYHSYNKESFVSVNEMNRYNDILSRNDYSPERSLLDASAEEVFMHLFKFISSIIVEPYNRRMTPLR